MYAENSFYQDTLNSSLKDNCEKDKFCANHLLNQYLKYLQYLFTWTRKMPVAILFNQQCLESLSGSFSLKYTGHEKSWKMSHQFSINQVMLFWILPSETYVAWKAYGGWIGWVGNLCVGLRKVYVPASKNEKEKKEAKQKVSVPPSKCWLTGTTSSFASNNRQQHFTFHVTGNIPLFYRIVTQRIQAT